jgi:hypothetical protein
MLKITIFLSQLMKNITILALLHKLSFKFAWGAKLEYLLILLE